METKLYDIVIVGAGPAGLCAALYARRAGKSVLVVEKDTFGGQMTLSPKIENFPTVGEATGSEIAEKMFEQVDKHGAEFEMATVQNVARNGNEFLIRTDRSMLHARSVILATGAAHRHLGLENEEDFIGEGISYCAVCDGAFYKDKNVCVIGGGNTALQEAVMLSELCSHVTIVQNLAALTGEPMLIDKLDKAANVDEIFNSVVESVLTDQNGQFAGITIKDTVSSLTQDVMCDGIFVAIGQVPVNTPFSNVIRLTEHGYADSEEDCKTVTEGLFVAGDCRKKSIRQVTTAVADGAVAALAAIRYLG